MAWQKGQSGNPAGRPKGIANQYRLRKAIADDVDDVINSVLMAAKAGDMSAAKLLLDRVLPALRPTDLPITLPLGESPSGAARNVLAAISDGRLTPDQGTRLLGGIAQQARIIEIDELVKRVEALEQMAERGTDNA